MANKEKYFPFSKAHNFAGASQHCFTVICVELEHEKSSFSNRNKNKKNSFFKSIKTEKTSVRLASFFWLKKKQNTAKKYQYCSYVMIRLFFCFFGFLKKILIDRLLRIVQHLLKLAIVSNKIKQLYLAETYLQLKVIIS